MDMFHFSLSQTKENSKEEKGYLLFLSSVVETDKHTCSMLYISIRSSEQLQTHKLHTSISENTIYKVHMKQKNKLDDFISTNSYCGKYIKHVLKCLQSSQARRMIIYCVYNRHKHIESGPI